MRDVAFCLQMTGLGLVNLAGDSVKCLHLRNGGVMCVISWKLKYFLLSQINMNRQRKEAICGLKSINTVAPWHYENITLFI